MHALPAFLLSLAGALIGTPWLLYHEARICSHGQRLPNSLTSWAAAKGLKQTDLIHILHEPIVPLPAPMFIRRALSRLGFPAAHVGGLCLRHGIYLQPGASNETLRHELIHTRQYQDYGSAVIFLFHYLFQSLTISYYDAPLEIEARAESR